MLLARQMRSFRAFQTAATQQDKSPMLRRLPVYASATICLRTLRDCGAMRLEKKGIRRKERITRKMRQRGQRSLPPFQVRMQCASRLDLALRCVALRLWTSSPSILQRYGCATHCSSINQARRTPVIPHVLFNGHAKYTRPRFLASQSACVVRFRRVCRGNVLSRCDGHVVGGIARGRDSHPTMWECAIDIVFDARIRDCPRDFG